MPLYYLNIELHKSNLCIKHVMMISFILCYTVSRTTLRICIFWKNIYYKKTYVVIIFSPLSFTLSIFRFLEIISLSLISISNTETDSTTVKISLFSLFLRSTIKSVLVFWFYSSFFFYKWNVEQNRLIRKASSDKLNIHVIFYFLFIIIIIILFFMFPLRLGQSKIGLILKISNFNLFFVFSFNISNVVINISNISFN